MIAISQTHSAHPELINTTTDIRLDFIHLLTTRKCTIQQILYITKDSIKKGGREDGWTPTHTHTNTHTPQTYTKKRLPPSNFPVANEIKDMAMKPVNSLSPYNSISQRSN